jgi:hypothetical protein
LASPATCISVSCNIRRARGKVSLRPMAASACSTEGYEDIRTLLSGFGGRKAPNSMGKISSAEVLRLRATSAVSRNQSVRRSAQDDDSVGEPKEKQQVPPLRYAPVPRQAGTGGMTNLRVAAHLGMGGGGWTEPAQQQLPRFRLPAFSSIFSKLRSAEGRSPANLDSSEFSRRLFSL